MGQRPELTGNCLTILGRSGSFFDIPTGLYPPRWDIQYGRYPVRCRRIKFKSEFKIPIMMNYLHRRTLLKMIGFAATGSLAARSGSRFISEAIAGELDALYQVPMQGNVRILHTTDVHAQLWPVYYREPNVNLGVGAAEGKLPHLVEDALRERAGFAKDAIETYAFTSLNFETNARKYGKMGRVCPVEISGRCAASAGGR